MLSMTEAYSDVTGTMALSGLCMAAGNGRKKVVQSLLSTAFLRAKASNEDWRQCTTTSHRTDFIFKEI